MRTSSEQSDLEECRQIVARASRSFYVSSWLLPTSVRHDAWVLYAFCRTADDAVDLEGQSADDTPERQLQRLLRRLEAVYLHRPEPRAVDRAFGRLVVRRALPRELPQALLDGMREDLTPRKVADESELEGYAVRVAGVVGLMMAHLMGVRDAHVLARANDLGVAMQYTNIARDVGEDARRGRVYLPTTWLREHGLDAQDVLDAKTLDPRLSPVIARLLHRAEAHYRRADVGVPYLPKNCRWAIASARHIYAAIGRDIERHGYDSITRRARVGGLGKIMLLGRALWDIAQRTAPVDIAPPSDAAGPLIEAMTRRQVALAA